MSGRALARIFDPTVTRRSLRDRGWIVDELNDPAMVVPHREFPSLEIAHEWAERDLPVATAVHWMSRGGITMGGFVVGHDGAAPPIADRFPAFVLWPDGRQDTINSIRDFVLVLRDRMDWMVKSAVDAGRDEAEIADGRAETERALDDLETGSSIPSCLGSQYHLACAARVQPRALVRWDGFRAGWEGDDERPVEQRRHPVHPRHSGDFLDCWQEGLRVGADARRRRTS
jgi:hypothetical protein